MPLRRWAPGKDASDAERSTTGFHFRWRALNRRIGSESGHTDPPTRFEDGSKTASCIIHHVQQWHAAAGDVVVVVGSVDKDRDVPKTATVVEEVRLRDPSSVDDDSRSSVPTFRGPFSPLDRLPRDDDMAVSRES